MCEVRDFVQASQSIDCIRMKEVKSYGFPDILLCRTGKQGGTIYYSNRVYTYLLRNFTLNRTISQVETSLTFTALPYDNKSSCRVGKGVPLRYCTLYFSKSHVLRNACAASRPDW